MKNTTYFDYQKVAQQMKVPISILRKIEQEVRKDFPDDLMLYELHVLRALRSKYWQKIAKANVSS